MAIPPTDIRTLFINYDIIAYFLNLASCSEHFISMKHRILATFSMNKKKINSDSLNAFKLSFLAKVLIIGTSLVQVAELFVNVCLISDKVTIQIMIMC